MPPVKKPHGKVSGSKAASSKKQIITIVHASDFHFRDETEAELSRRAKAFLADVEAECDEVDLFIFSGDLSYAGSKAELEAGDKILIEAFKTRLHVGRKHIVVVPGNHDVNRKTIEPLKEQGLHATLTNTGVAQEIIQDFAASDKRLKAFYKYRDSYFGTGDDYAYTAIEKIKGLTVGIAALNTACFSHNSKESGQLFLTSKQVNNAADKLANCDIRIAVFHHPPSWLHESETTVTLSDLKRQFHIILNGHLHENISIHEQSPIAKCVQLVSPALFNEEDPTREGYNIYSIDISEKRLFCRFRKFIRTRFEFDQNTEHARGGRFECELPVSVFSENAILVTRLGQSTSDLIARIKSQLQLFQPTDTPVFVTTKLFKLIWDHGNRVRTAIRYSYDGITDKSSFIYGAPECGKTLFLETLVANLNGDDETGRRSSKAAYYIDHESVQSDAPEDWKAYLTNWQSQNVSSSSALKSVICVDNIPEDRQALVDIAVRFCEAIGAVFILTIDNTFQLDAIRASVGDKAYDFLEIGEWGPSRIREFTKKFFADTAIDLEAAYFFVRSSLENTDLPASPIIVSLYLSVFPSLGSDLTSLSFVALLDRLEVIRLHNTESSSTYAVYNKREILMRFAKVCQFNGDIGLAREEAERIIKAFFLHLLLEVDVDKFLGHLFASQIVRQVDDRVEFTYFVFYDYYLAKAFAKGIAEVDNTIVTLRDFIANREALSFLAGILREDTKLLEKLIAHIINVFAPLKRVTVEDLDKYVHSLCDNEDIDKSVDEVTTKHIEAEPDIEAEDPHFEQRKSQYRSVRKALNRIRAPDGEVGGLRTQMGALRTFYNMFRNLENISGLEKIRLLDLILDYHIQCNISFITFIQKIFSGMHSTAVSAYLATVGGQHFLAAQLGSQSLKVAIQRCEEGTDNDFKKLLLILLYSDLGLPEHVKRLENFLEKTDSTAALELIYARARGMLIYYDGDKVPAALVSLFKAAFERRQQLYNGKHGKEQFSSEYAKVMRARNQLNWRTDAVELDE
jgi:DNA repair exonuclease SbcCD nuclease subunit